MNTCKFKFLIKMKPNKGQRSAIPVNIKREICQLQQTDYFSRFYIKSLKFTLVTHFLGPIEGNLSEGRPVSRKLTNEC